MAVEVDVEVDVKIVVKQKRRISPILIASRARQEGSGGGVMSDSDEDGIIYPSDSGSDNGCVFRTTAPVVVIHFTMHNLGDVDPYGQHDTRLPGGRVRLRLSVPAAIDLTSAPF